MSELASGLQGGCEVDGSANRRVPLLRSASLFTQGGGLSGPPAGEAHGPARQTANCFAVKAHPQQPQRSWRGPVGCQAGPSNLFSA